jgi:ADP-ribose pyrophosphatase YjhB (NUDIX family)
MIKRYLLAVWRIFPAWLQVVLSRLIRPLFQVGAIAVIFDENSRILLVRSTYQRFHPWGLPGGSLEYSERPEDAVLREVREETGLETEIERLLLVNTWSPDKVGLYYLCRITGGTFHLSEEVSQADYFSPHDLPDVRPWDVDLIRQLYKIMEYELA